MCPHSGSDLAWRNPSLMQLLQARDHALHIARILEQCGILLNGDVTQEQHQERLESEKALAREKTEGLVSLEERYGRGGQPPAIQSPRKVVH
jgi:hypothetical protein